MHARKMLLAANQASTRLFVIVEACFVLSFFAVRICGGAWFLARGIAVVLFESECVPMALRINGAVNVLGATALNAYWWVAIMGALRRKLRSKKTA